MGKRRNPRMYCTFQSETFKEGGEVKPIAEFPRNGVNANGNPEWRQDCKCCYNIRRSEAWL